MKSYQFPLPTGHPGVLMVPDETPPGTIARVIFSCLVLGPFTDIVKRVVKPEDLADPPPGAPEDPAMLLTRMLIRSAIDTADQIRGVKTDAALDALLVDMVAGSSIAEKLMDKVTAPEGPPCRTSGPT